MGTARKLKKEVLDKGRCTGCGFCVDFCPYFKVVDERIGLIHFCGLQEGICYDVCPRTPTDLPRLDQGLFGRERRDPFLGDYLFFFYARAKEEEIRKKGQYGGVVSALALTALETGKVEGVVLTGGEKASFPTPFFARGKEEILAGSSSKYSAAPTLAAFHTARREGFTKIAVVGRPCQVTALRKWQVSEKETSPEAATELLVIGLFCFWALAPEFYRFLVTKVPPEAVLKLDVSETAMVATTKKGEILIPLAEIRRFIRPACEECFDPTAELSDVAVGATEFDPGWNTLLVRTRQGKELVRKALKKGLLELKSPLPQKVVALRQAALQKKRRVALALAQEGGAYLAPSQRYLAQVLAGEVDQHGLLAYGSS